MLEGKKRRLWRSGDGLRTDGQGRAQLLSRRGDPAPFDPLALSLNRSNSSARTRLELVKLTSLLLPFFPRRSPSPTRETRHPPAACRANRTMAEQVEKSFQKQPLFHNAKVATTSRKVAGKDRRWYKEVGLGFKVRLSCSSSAC